MVKHSDADSSPLLAQPDPAQAQPVLGADVEGATPLNLVTAPADQVTAEAHVAEQVAHTPGEDLSAELTVWVAMDADEVVSVHRGEAGAWAALEPLIREAVSELGCTRAEAMSWLRAWPTTVMP